MAQLQHSPQDEQAFTDSGDSEKEADYTQRLWDQYDEDTRCGIRECQPTCLQRLSSKKTYILVYGLIGLYNFAISSYFSSTITTIEKRFKISSKTSGLIVSALEMGGLSLSLIMSYLGSRGHKTRWVACGTLLVSLSCFLRLLPHIIYGAGQDALQLTVEYGAFPPDSKYDNGTVFRSNSTATSEHNKFDQTCSRNHNEDEDCSVGSSTNTPFIIFFLSFYVMGVGTSMYYTLGLAYLDDNVKKTKAPFLISVATCIRMIGPTVGYLVGSYVLSIYIDTSVHSTITTEDPRWIGAWWLGWGPFGVVGALLALAIAFFPKKLPRVAQREIQEIVANENKIKAKPKRSLADFKTVLSRLLQNKVLLLNTFSSVLFIMASMGYMIFMPKYMETQFRKSASEASFLMGIIGLVFPALGIMVSGYVISRFKPSARILAGYNVFVEVLDMLGCITYSFLTCAVNDLHGSPLPDSSWNLMADCNEHCDCGTTLKYSPVCSSDGSTTFFSPCHAGCTTVEWYNGTKIFGNCSCITGHSESLAVEGICPKDCSFLFTVFLALRCFTSFCSSSGRAGNILVQFRCVDEHDKSVAIGFMEALLCALVFIPGPVMYGTLLDSVCLVWGQTCGEQGNCWLYDGVQLGYLLNFTAFGCTLVGTVLDVGVWYYVRDLQIYDKEEIFGERKLQKHVSK